ncbi:VACUOLAR SORTING RECEPTOR 38, Unflattened and Small Leaves 1 [Hibiscus trionum]|uniref:VACUOLAR SORTING RECEPTOR 38, Unflattened and Small Leaves 1 n=1 Tax=Hibiscus trionum TaxID=183268 RepID=A0A9W7GRG5_HIBTR|nr:VACUOLAR SORTING RECEPTOR 38, Unflattened and Small Leaves 1 [Hibiscus trionum]
MDNREQQDRGKALITEPKQINAAHDNVQVIEWEDFESEVARLWSLISALKEANEKKQSLEEKLQSLIQVKTKSLNKLNELEETRERLEARKLVMTNMSSRCKVATEDAKNEEEMLSTEVRSLLVAGTSLSVARKQLHEANRLLTEERGYVKLKDVQRKLRARQQYMISQVSLLYPVKILVGPAQEQELESYSSSSRLGNSFASKPVNQGSLTILVPWDMLHMCVPLLLHNCFTNCILFKGSFALSSVLGWFSHAPSIEIASSDLSSDAALTANVNHAEFPLFLDGQDTTRAAYAVFLLNKDIEQLLNSMGVKSL